MSNNDSKQTRDEEMHGPIYSMYEDAKQAVGKVVDKVVGSSDSPGTYADLDRAYKRSRAAGKMPGSR